MEIVNTYHRDESESQVEIPIYLTKFFANLILYLRCMSLKENDYVPLPRDIIYKIITMVVLLEYENPTLKEKIFQRPKPNNRFYYVLFLALDIRNNFSIGCMIPFQLILFNYFQFHRYSFFCPCFAYGNIDSRKSINQIGHSFSDSFKLSGCCLLQLACCTFCSLVYPFTSIGLAGCGNSRIVRSNFRTELGLENWRSDSCDSCLECLCPNCFDGLRNNNLNSRECYECCCDCLCECCFPSCSRAQMLGEIDKRYFLEEYQNQKLFFERVKESYDRFL